MGHQTWDPDRWWYRSPVGPRLQDPVGILDGFLERVLAAEPARPPALAGPDPGQVADDPGAEAHVAAFANAGGSAAPGARAGSRRLLPLTPPEETPRW